MLAFGYYKINIFLLSHEHPARDSGENYTRTSKGYFSINF